MKTDKVTLTQLEQWIENDEGLYLEWRYSRLSLRRFARENREALTEAWQRMINAAPAVPFQQRRAA